MKHITLVILALLATNSVLLAVSDHNNSYERNNKTEFKKWNDYKKKQNDVLIKKSDVAKAERTPEESDEDEVALQ
jgi:hypothetical protein